MNINPIGFCNCNKPSFNGKLLVQDRFQSVSLTPSEIKRIGCYETGKTTICFETHSGFNSINSDRPLTDVLAAVDFASKHDIDVKI